MILEHVISDWGTFRRALSLHDRAVFDAMMYRARLHAAASSNAARLNPTEALFMAILLEHEKELQELKKSIESRESMESMESIESKSQESRVKNAKRSKDDEGEG
jgi:hypothetical protein